MEEGVLGTGGDEAVAVGSGAGEGGIGEVKAESFEEGVAG